MDRSLFESILQSKAHPEDAPFSLEMLTSYWVLFCAYREINPKRIVEIGVRRGYSALTAFLAVPDVEVFGYDLNPNETDPHSSGGVHNGAEFCGQLLSAYRFALNLVNSGNILRLPTNCACYIDGEHTIAGTYWDLRLAAASSKVILVDDALDPNVSEAVSKFRQDQPNWHLEYRANGYQGLYILRPA